MGDTTDQLIALAKKENPHPPKREHDMLVTVGERISISLLAMALAAKQKEAISFRFLTAEYSLRHTHV